MLEAYFDPVRGHGYSLCRVHMGSCDFALGNYAHVETPGDLALASFSINRDRQALLPFIQAAQRVAGTPIKLLASPWSPPGWMKTTDRMNDGGKLRAECRSEWARCYVRFIQSYEAEGVPIWGVSVQNEPMATQRWDSCLYTAEEERDFVRDFLGPELEAAGLGHVTIVIWDHNRDLMVERARTVYNDNRWTVGWIDWNLLLDQQGGPNHVGHFCSSPIHVTSIGIFARRNRSSCGPRRCVSLASASWYAGPGRRTAGRVRRRRW